MAGGRTLIVSALLFVAIASFAYAQQAPTGPRMFKAKGRVFCDTCLVGFPTKVSYSLGGAELRLTCVKPNTDPPVTVLDIGGIKSNSDGEWQTKLEMKDYGSDICRVHLVKSRDPECNIMSPRVNSSRVSLAYNITFTHLNRETRDLAFQVQTPRHDCQKALEGINPNDHYVPEDRFA